MNLAEDFGRTVWRGSTAPTPTRRANVDRKFTIVDDDVQSDPDSVDQVDNFIDFPTQKSYIPQISSISTNVSCIFTDTDEVVQVMSKNRPKMVAVDSVIKNASIIVGLLSALSVLATILSGAVILQPFI